jgi:hypothetical protein
MSRGCNCKGLLNSWGLPENSVPEVESAPQFFIKSYPQPYPQGRARLWITAQPAQQAPPVVELQAGVGGTPQQKIFAKVKAAIWPLTCGYIYCDEGHILKTGNQVNFLPYI